MAKKRPSTTKGGYGRIVGYLKEPDYDRFVEYAEREGIPQSVLIRMALKEFLRQRGVDSETDR